MKIIFGLSRAKSLWAIFSKSIMKIEKRPFSHVFVLFEEPVSKIPVVFHAAKGFVHFISLNRFELSNEIAKRYEVILNGVPQELSPFVTEEILLQVKSKILGFLQS